jgi:hypothetical protein
MDMDFHRFTNIIDQAASLNMETISVVGYGEPLLYPHFSEAMHYVRNKLPDTEIMVTTNGVILTKALSADIINCEVDQIIISVNASSSKKYKFINKADGFDRVVSNTKDFLSILNGDRKKRRTRAYVQILKEFHTQDEISEFCKFWSPYLDPNASVSVKSLTDWMGLVDLSWAHLKGLVQPNAFERERYPCMAIYYDRVVTVEGKVLACCLALPIMPESLIIGDARESSLADIFCSNRARFLKELNLGEGLETIYPCEKCDRWRDRPNIFIRNRIPLTKRKWF